MRVPRVLQRLRLWVGKKAGQKVPDAKDQTKPLSDFAGDKFLIRPARSRILPIMLATEFDALVRAKVKELDSATIRKRIANMKNIDGYLHPRIEEDFSSYVDRRVACSMAKLLLGRGYPLEGDIDREGAHRAVLYTEIALHYDYENPEARRLWGIGSIVESLVADGESK